MKALSRARLPYALITLGVLAPVTVAVVYSFHANDAPRAISPTWLMVAKLGLPLCVAMGLVGVALAWRDTSTPVWRLALVLVAAVLLLAIWAMFFG